MPSKKRTVAAQAAARGPLPEMPAELIEQLVQKPLSASEVQDLFLSFQKAVIERMMNAEMSQHLGYKPILDNWWRYMFRTGLPGTQNGNHVAD